MRTVHFVGSRKLSQEFLPANSGHPSSEVVSHNITHTHLFCLESLGSFFPAPHVTWNYQQTKNRKMEGKGQQRQGKTQTFFIWRRLDDNMHGDDNAWNITQWAAILRNGPAVL